jgi:ComF family protein
MFHALARQAAAWLPSQCAVCHLWQQDVVCADCLARFGAPVRRCLSCALVLPVAPPSDNLHQCGACIAASSHGPLPLDSCSAAVSYAFPWDQLIVRFKFGKEPAWARFFANRMLQQMGVQEALPAARWCLPMPLSDARLRERGYNQAALLARELAAQVSATVPQAQGQVDDRLLLRVLDTMPQPGLDRAARVANLRGALLVDPLRQALVEGQSVVLVDDVMTSGASLHAAAQALRAAGASAVHAVVFARTERDGTDLP